MHAPSAWVFDLDGTLVDTLPDLLGALNEALAGQGAAGASFESARAALSTGIEAMVIRSAAAAGCRDIDALTAAFERCYAARLDGGASPYPGVEAFLDTLAASGARIGVCTNRSEQMAHRLLEAAGLAHRFPVVVGADTCAWRKPHPAPLLRAIDVLRASPREAVLVGDSEVDAECAHRAQVAFWLHGSGYGRAGLASAASRAFMHWDELNR